MVEVNSLMFTSVRGKEDIGEVCYNLDQNAISRFVGGEISIPGQS